MKKIDQKIVFILELINIESIQILQNVSKINKYNFLSFFCTDDVHLGKNDWFKIFSIEKFVIFNDLSWESPFLNWKQWIKKFVLFLDNVFFI